MAKDLKEESSIKNDSKAIRCVVLVPSKCVRRNEGDRMIVPNANEEGSI